MKIDTLSRVLALTVVLVSSQAAAQNVAQTNPGLQNWSAAYAQAKYSVVNIVVLGDSITACYQAACSDGVSAAAVRFPDQLRAYFEAAGLSHGSGVIPVEAQLIGPAINASFWTLTGRFVESALVGPSQTTLAYNNGSALIQLAPGASAALAAQTGDTLKVYCAEASDSTSGLAVTIDGTAVGTACGAAAAAPTALVQIFKPPTGLGSHTVVLTSNSTGNAYLYGAEWTVGNTGVSVHNLAVGAAAAEAYGSNVRAQLAFSDLIQGGTQLAISLLGTNEPGLNIPVSTYTSSLTNIAQHEQSLGASVLLISPPPLGVYPQGSELAAYQAAAQQVASSVGAAYLDFSQWGTFAQASANGLFEADNAHLSENGENLLFEMIAQDVLVSDNAAAPFNGGTVTNPLNLNVNLSPSASNAFSETLSNSNSTGVSSVLFGASTCSSNSNAFWQGETGSNYAYSVPNAFVLFDCNTGHFPFLVFPSGDISISGNSFGLNGGSWTIPSDQGGALQVTGGLTADTLHVAGALNTGTTQVAGILSAGTIQVAGAINASAIQLASTATQPNCNQLTRGTFLFVQTQGNGQDHLQVCAAISYGLFSWVPVF